MSGEAWGDPPEHEPQFCPLCGGRQHAEDKLLQMREALRIARAGYASEAATGMPVAPEWRDGAMAMIDAALMDERRR